MRNTIGTNLSKLEIMIKIAMIEVEASRLEDYKKILKKEIESSLSLEEDVYVLYPVWDNENPNKFTILEVYKDQEAYERHCQTPHLRKYFLETKGMVKSLEITDATPLMDKIWMK